MPKGSETNSQCLHTKKDLFHLSIFFHVDENLRGRVASSGLGKQENPEPVTDSWL